MPWIVVAIYGITTADRKDSKAKKRTTTLEQYN